MIRKKDLLDKYGAKMKKKTETKVFAGTRVTAFKFLFNGALSWSKFICERLLDGI